MFKETEEILNIATSTKANTEKLLPLLDLLQKSEDETSPINEIKALLSALIEILGHHTATLQRLENASASGPPQSR